MNDRKLIPISQIEITLDPEKTTAYDFTVEDFYTFATHDGIFVQDTMAVHIPLGDEAKKEVREKAFSTKSLVNPGNLTLSTTPSQDIVLGLYYLSANQIEQLQGEVEYKGVTMTPGQKIINECFPEKYPPILDELNDRKIEVHLNTVFRLYPDEIVETLDKVKHIGFKWATLAGCTISLENVRPMTELKEKLFSNTTVSEQLKLLNDNSIMKEVEDNFEYSYIIKCGARGKMDQVKQMVFCRGFLSNFKGQIVKTPIKNSFCDGLTKKEFFISSYGARKGLLDVAVKTSDSGYLFRKYLYTMINLILDDAENDSDCGSTDYLTVFVADAKRARSLHGKWFTLDPNNHNLILVNEKTELSIVGKTIFIRSPIHCKNEFLCKRCYGNNWKLFNSRFVGVIAAQSMGEVNTQLVLRTFHLSGVAQISSNEEKTKEGKDGNIAQHDIIGALSAVSKLIHRYKDITSPEMVVNELYNIYNESRVLNHVHFECLVAQVMWTKDNIKWRLDPDRNNTPFEFVSVQSVAARESWRMGIAFSNTKKELINGLIRGDHQYKSPVDKFIYGKEF